MKKTKYVLALVLVSVGLAVPRAAKADIVNVSISNLTYNGSKVCGPSGIDLCSQTLSLSFQWDNSTNTSISGSFSYSTSGIFGSTLYSPFAVADNSLGPLELVVGLDTQSNASSSDTLALILYLTPTGLPSGPYTQAVAPNFPPFAGPGLLPNTFAPNLTCYFLNPCVTKSWFAAWNLANPTGASIMVSPVPEPSSLLLLGTGLLGLMGMGLYKKRLA